MERENTHSKSYQFSHARQWTATQIKARLKKITKVHLRPYQRRILGVITVIIMELNQTPVLAMRATAVMKQLGIGRSTLKKWVDSGRLHVLPFFSKYRMFSADEVTALAKVPTRK